MGAGAAPYRVSLMALCAGLALGQAGPTMAQQAPLPRVLVTGQSLDDGRRGQGLPARQLERGRAATSDTARLLQDLLGVSLGGAGGVSSLPALNGLGGDRVRTQVDGMDLVAACPNHMNSPLSYLDPRQVGAIRVYAGIAPVSVGGDSLGGTIQVEAPQPLFAAIGERLLQGQFSAFARASGHERGGSLAATTAGESFSLSVIGASSRRENYRSARAFKPEAAATEGGPLMAGDEVASSAYRARNAEIALAARHQEHLLQLKFGHQDLGFEGFPNQRMDMTANRSSQLNLRYTGSFDWGDVLGRLYQQTVDHKMDMGPDRYRYGFGMPMDTEARTRGGLLQASLPLDERHLLRVGGEAQGYRLYDWWPAVGGSMGPNAFWNVDYGRRNKAGLFAELDSAWSERWSGQLGLRADRVLTDAAAVQGYDNGLGAIWGNEAAAFNARPRRRVDQLLDAVAQLWFRPAPGLVYEFGAARKSRAPNLYQRYPWSTQPMAALMNNFAGDGNGYIGQPDLRPETASTLMLAALWQAADPQDWSVKASVYATRISDYIDARRCDFGQCGSENSQLRQGFVLLQYANQRARMHGLDLSAQARLLQDASYGSLSASAVLKYISGRNSLSGDRLYNIMPLNLNLGLEQRLGGWSGRIELLAVASKGRVSQVRNEMQTPGYALLNLRGSHDWPAWRLDFGIENLLNRAHAPPLGGAYLGQGRSMTSAGIAWGTTVPGPARSAYASLNHSF